MIQFNHTSKNDFTLTIVLDRFFIAEECWIFSCILLYRRDLLFLQPEVYLLHFLVWKGFYICYK